MAERSTDAELRERELAALQLLATGAGSAFTAQTLAERYGCSLRQARRYVNVAALELCEPMVPSTLDSMAALALHRLDLISGRAMAAGDDSLAVRATKAHASALAQFRRALSAPSTRFRLPDRRAGPIDDGSDPNDPNDAWPF